MELREEVEAHVALCVEHLVARGAPPDAALRQARARFGDIDLALQRLYTSASHKEDQVQRREWWQALRQDVSFTLRQLHRSPAFAITVAVTLGLGIGANAAMFGITDRLLLRPPAGVQQPNDVVRLYYTRTFGALGVLTQAGTAYPDYQHLRDHSHAFSGVAAFATSDKSMGIGQDAREVHRVAATASLFPVLRVRPALGRFFVAEEDLPPIGTAVVVLSYGLWQTQFGGDTSALGRTIQLGKAQFRIIGVAPRDFTGIDLEPVDVWVPLSSVGRDLMGEQWYELPTQSASWLRIIARKRRGVTIDAANADASRIFRAGLAGGPVASLPDSNARTEVGSVIAARGPGKSQLQTSAHIATWLSAMSLIVLLVACANVANLLLARAARRRREIAVRVVLGVGRGRLIRQMATESVLLSLSGAIPGVAIAIWGGAAARRALLPDIQWTSSFDSRVLGLALLATCITAVLIGILPTMHANRLDVAGDLKTGGREGAPSRSTTRSVLLVTQAALSTCLLVGCGLFVKSLRHAVQTDMGFDPKHVLVVQLPGADVDFTAAQVKDFYETAARRIRSLPGVSNAAVGTSVPFSSAMSVRLFVPGLDSVPHVADGGPYINVVSPAYFATLGTRIVRGRGLVESDVAYGPTGAIAAAVVSETMARMLWPGGSAIGHCLKIGADTVPCTPVVGVAKDAHRQNVDPVPVMQYYVSLPRHATPQALFVRTTDEDGTSMARVRVMLQTVVPGLPRLSITRLQSLIDPGIQPWRLGATMFSVFGLVALLIAAVGLYGVLAFEVTQRSHEIGVRFALGATRYDVISIVVRRAVLLTASGVAIGATIAAVVGPHGSTLLFDTSATDGAVFATVGSVLLGAAVLASLLPAVRATRIDPAQALRGD